VTDQDLALSTQWIYDITQEFAYQFQGFCQYRCHVAALNADSIKLLQANHDAWNLTEVISMLTKLIESAKSKTTTSLPLQISVVQQLGYFASIELARVQCLLGDFPASLSAIQHLKLSDKQELFYTLPICHFNVFYHTAVSHMMLHQFPQALDVFQEIILYVLRLLKPGASNTMRNGVPQQLPRMVDKAMSLTAILLTIYPQYRLDEVVKEAIEAKFTEKMKRLTHGERNSATELFDSACPKFISAAIPDYTIGVNIHQEVIHKQSQSIINEIMQYVPFLKLRSFLILYASIDISKLARFMELSDDALIALLALYKQKYGLGDISSSTATATAAAKPAVDSNKKVSSLLQQGNLVKDINFMFEGSVLIVESPNKLDTSSYDRYFVSGTKKHQELIQQLARIQF